MEGTGWRWGVGLLLLGLFLTLRGYHSREGDQAYRLPLLLNMQEPGLYAHDPFVRAFDAFQPHRGYLLLLDRSSRLIGLSASLFTWYAAAFLMTCSAFERMSRAVWPERSSWTGLAVLGMVTLTKAGNIGTNHLFEPELLDRFLAFALGWQAVARFLEQPGGEDWRGPAFVAAAAWVHPSVGFQVGMLLIAGRLGCLLPVTQSLPAGRTVLGCVAVVAALVPGEALVWGQAGRLFEGLPAEEFRLLSLYVQNPQHMVPELWRRAQWLAWFGFPILASLEVLRPGGGWPGARQRWAVLLTLTLLGLGLAWVAVGPLESLRAAVFQPFRMATVVRGLCLVAIGARAVRLWQRGRGLDQMRAGLLVGGLAGDEAFVVVVLLELGASAAARLSLRASTGTAVVALAGGLLYLARHDPHSGHLPLLAAGVIAACGSWASRRRRVRWTTGRLVRLNLLAWTVPALALILPLVPTARSSRLTEFLIARCRFGETPIDAVERLGLWCRAHTPPDARFIGPPGPKTFRLWSRRELAFNRAASPYHAAGLADWARRFQDHVGFRGGTAAFARSYLADRQALEARYEDLSDAELVHLARRQGATHILASARRSDSPLLERLRVDGEYAIYRIRELPHVAHQDQGENQEQRRK